MGSLRLRLLVAGALSILIALMLAAAGLVFLFERNVERWIEGALAEHLNQLVAAIRRGPDGSFTVAEPPSDPRFHQPLSGLYWQVVVDNPHTVLRSRSLWDSELHLREADAPLDAHRAHYRLDGPGGKALFVVQHRFVLPANFGGSTSRAAVAIDRSSIAAAAQSFTADLAPFLLVIGALLILAAWVQVEVGLRPLAAIRRGLAAIRTGTESRLVGEFPDEVRPLATELNDLLDARDAQVERGRMRAADLAHGLKTPLQILAGEVARLQGKGESQIAADLSALADAMNRHVDRHLTRARLSSASSDVSADVADAVERVMRVVHRTPDGERVTWSIDIPRALRLRIDPADLEEALGNLIENAARHARSAVTISAYVAVRAVEISVADDGPGIPQHLHEAALKRGWRLDTDGASSGLGLAIASDIADAWGATLGVTNSERGLVFTMHFAAGSRGDT